MASSPAICTAAAASAANPSFNSFPFQHPRRLSFPKLRSIIPFPYRSSDTLRRIFSEHPIPPPRSDLRLFFRLSSVRSFPESDDDDDDDDHYSFDIAVFLFNSRDYYKCHDVLENLWNRAEEPRRTLLHGILQCAVGFHHLFNQNHRGAMMELGEGLCKLRKMDFSGGPFLQFEKQISATLDFVYQTQLELAACTDDFCLAMDGSERSYQLLGSFAAGQHLYKLQSDPDVSDLYIVFLPEGSYKSDEPARVRVPTLHATEEDLQACEYH